jgi:type III secretion protein L
MRSVRDVAGVRIEPIAVRTAEARAQEITERANAEAQSIIERARGEAERIAVSAAERAALDARERVVAEYAAGLLRAEQARQIAERDVVALALEVARTVLGREAETSSSVLESVAKTALARVRRARSVVLRVSPSEAAAAREKVREWLAPGADPAVLEVVEDDAVPRGGAMVECELGRIDARIETQLAAIGRALEGA